MYNLLMSTGGLVLIYLFYGLSFFSMGLIVLIEGGRGSDERLQRALRPLAVFGIIHGLHEWYEIFEILYLLPGQLDAPLLWSAVRLFVLAFSFFSLTAFGAAMLSPTENIRRISLLVPLAQAAIWGFGLLFMYNRYIVDTEIWDVADVWTRYVVAIPGALLACAGLIYQQRAFRQAGMERFGQDSLWAAVAFAWYGIVGQTFTKATSLPFSNVINQDLFLSVFGFPVQLLRAVAAMLTAIFVARFLRSFEVEKKRQIAELQAARLHEAERRETLRGEMLRRIVAAQEAERQRIARELHDETGQALTAIGLGLRGIATHLGDDVGKAAQNLRQLEGMAVQSLDELRRIIADLRPSHLDDLGLPAALRWYAGEVENRTPLKIHVEAPQGSCQLPLMIKTAMFRVAQEALTNVVKHAEAQNVWIKLQCNDKDVKCDLRDDGKGFDLSNLPDGERTAWGLMGMQERVSLCGGEFLLNSSPGNGTQIRVVIPCHPALAIEDGNED